MADPYDSVAISGYNTNPPADDGSAVEANRVKWATIKTKLNDPLKTRTDSMDAAISAAFAKIMGGAGVTSTSISYTVLSTDQGKLVRATNSGITITTPDATDVDAPFVFCLLNNSSGNITLDGNGSQTIDGDASLTVPADGGVMIFTDGANWFTTGQNYQRTFATSLFPGFLSGLELSTAGSSATFGIAVGAANDTTNATLMVLASAYTKTTSAWAVGTGNGALDTGTIAPSTWYHVWLIARSDTGVVDVLVSTSVSAPTMPTNYDRKRRIGSMKTNGSSQWTKFTQSYDTFIWQDSVNDGVSVGSGSRTSVTLTVPTGVVVTALARVNISSGGGPNSFVFTSLFETDIAASGNVDLNQQAAGALDAANIARLTNTSAQIGVRGSATLTPGIYTYGWIDPRGK